MNNGTHGKYRPNATEFFRREAGKFHEAQLVQAKI
jgi:hypothetical protein